VSAIISSWTWFDEVKPQMNADKRRS